jgi:hypothetical protein
MPCAAEVSRRVAELRSLRRGLPPHLTTFDLDAPGDDSAAEEVGENELEGVSPRVARLVPLLRDGRSLTGESVSALLGCSARTGRRLLAEAHRVLASSSE